MPRRATSALSSLPPTAAPPVQVKRRNRMGSLLFASRLRQGLTLGVLCALIIGFAEMAGWFDGVQRGALNAMFSWRGRLLPSPDILLVEADEGTLVRFGQWPLPRKVYADLVNTLKASGARTIVFDVQFPVHSERPQDDRALVEACRRAGNVVQAAVFSPQAIPDVSMTPSQTRELSHSAARFRITDRGKAGLDASSGTAPFKELLETAPFVGHVTVYPEWNGGLLRIPHLIRYRGDAYPSLALAAAAHFLGVKPKDIVATNDEILIADRHIPITKSGEALVNWTGPTGVIPSFTFQQVLEPRRDLRLPKDTFKGAVVLIGITHPGAYERYATPFSPNQPAVELQANALDNILENRPLRELPESWHLLLWLGACLLAGVLTAHRGARASTLWMVGIVALLWLFGFALLWYKQLYLDIASPILGVLLTCAVTLGYRQLRDARDLKIAEERYALAARGANDGIWDWNLQTGAIYYSPRWCSMLGLGKSISSAPEEWFRRVHHEDADKLQADLKRHLEGNSLHFENEHRILHADETYRWMLARGLRVTGERGKPTRIAGSLTDITERRVAEETLLHNAFYDGLTGLPNRALFMDRLGRAMGRARRQGHYLFAVLFLDLDRFKVVNDSLGHVIGDQLLIAVARRLDSCLRPGDTAARLGGDEFTLLLDDIHDDKDATRIAERFQSELSKPFLLDGHEVFAAASIGIAISGERGVSTPYQRPEELLRDADTAMYRAKALGRGRHEVFDADMHARAVALLQLETDLRHAIEREDFRVFYQPIISLENGHISGFEALARWDHPERGIVPPGEFIALAEETGLVIALDYSILKQACHQLRRWQEQLPVGSTPVLALSANLSSKHFSQGDVVAEIEQILLECDFPPQALRLEVTESVILDNIESAATILSRLKSLGVQLSLDDFGTGYSSLSYLHRLPLDTLKVDRSFVARMGGKDDNTEIVRAIVTLARNMKMAVIAEGVETTEQARILRELNCDYAQGFYFSRPVPAEEATKFLETEKAWPAFVSANSRNGDGALPQSEPLGPMPQTE